MGKNSLVYNREYYSRKRKALITKLGGKCEACGIKQDLIVHRIFSPYNTGQKDYERQTTFDGEIGTVNKFTPVSTTVLKERTKRLRNSPNNMVLLCNGCYLALVRIHGRKQKIGRVEIGYFKGDF